MLDIIVKYFAYRPRQAYLACKIALPLQFVGWVVKDLWREAKHQVPTNWREMVNLLNEGPEDIYETCAEAREILESEEHNE